MIELDHLEKVYLAREGSHRALHDVSLTIGEGEIFGIIGQSGAGKSTLVRCINLLERPTSGRILIDGVDVTDYHGRELRKLREGIGMIFQNPLDSLNPVYTTGTQVNEAIMLDGVSRLDGWKKVIELYRSIKMPDPEKRAKAFPHEMSGGMRQRVMIAMMISRKPQLLIADEPTTALDVTVQAQVLEQLNSLRAEFGTSLMIITHNLGIVARYADSVKIVYGGKIVEEGSVEQIFEDPYHPYTIGLISAVPRLDLPRSHGLHTIEGEPPDMSKIPPRSCAFAQRCRYCTEKCRTHRPPLKQLGGGHACACFHMDEAHRGAEEVLQA